MASAGLPPDPRGDASESDQGCGVLVGGVVFGWAGEWTCSC